MSMVVGMSYIPVSPEYWSVANYYFGICRDEYRRWYRFVPGLCYTFSVASLVCGHALVYMRPFCRRPLL